MHPRSLIVHFVPSKLASLPTWCVSFSTDGVSASDTSNMPEHPLLQVSWRRIAGHRSAFSSRHPALSVGRCPWWGSSSDGNTRNRTVSEPSLSYGNHSSRWLRERLNRLRTMTASYRPLPTQRHAKVRRQLKFAGTSRQDRGWSRCPCWWTVFGKGFLGSVKSTCKRCLCRPPSQAPDSV